MADEGDILRPIIIDLGKKKRKRIRQLKRGRGRLMGDVYDVVDEVRDSLGDEAKGKEFVPVVVIYRRKRKRGGKAVFPIPLPI